MSNGKYSPSLTRAHCDRGYDAYCYNADKQLPPEWTLEMRDAGMKFDARLYMGCYDDEGYDSYGYSAFDADGNYVGEQNGVDRWGYTEMEYLSMSDDEFESICIYGG